MNKKIIIYLLAAFIAITFIIRLVGLTSSPPGFFCDEASFGYNAYSILETGKDEWGTSFPVFFRALGDYKNPVFVYLLIPAIKVFGLSIFSVRFTVALLGIFSIIAFIYLAYLLSKNKVLALLGGLTMSVLPWHFYYSRIGFEAISYVLFIILALVFFARFLKEEKPLNYFLFGVATIISFFAYSTGRMMVPIMVFAILIIWHKKIFTRINILISSLLAFLFVLILIYDNSIHPAGLIERANSIAIWNNSPGLLTTAKYFLKNYLTHFSPQFLFQSGDFNLRHSSGISSMILTSFIFPLIFGLYYVIKNIKDKFNLFLLSQLVLFPFASSLTIIEEGAQATRSIQVVPFVSLVIAYGLWQIYLSLKGKYPQILYILALFFLSELGFFYFNYFTAYPIKAADYFNYGMPETLKFSLGQETDRYYISRNVLAYNGIDVAFFTNFDPAEYQRTRFITNVRYIDPQKLNPLPNSIAVYSVNDDIKHFNNEELIYTFSYIKPVVKRDENEGFDFYSQESVDRYYVYKYQ